MYAFRDAFEARDAQKDTVEYRDGERVVSERAALRKRGANEAQLKKNLSIDLIHLANSINLGAAEDLDQYANVKKSILNFGVLDLSSLTSEDIKNQDLPRQLKEALLNCEPRFVAKSLEVKMREEFDDVNQRISLDIYAEMACRPVDIPLEFTAEIDVGSGKMKFSQLS